MSPGQLDGTYEFVFGAGQVRWTIASRMVAMDESGYRAIFQSLDIWGGCMGSSYSMKLDGIFMNMYFKHNKDGVYFLAYVNRYELYPDDLWRRIYNRPAHQYGEFRAGHSVCDPTPGKSMQPSVTLSNDFAQVVGTQYPRREFRRRNCSIRWHRCSRFRIPPETNTLA